MNLQRGLWVLEWADEPDCGCYCDVPCEGGRYLLVFSSNEAATKYLEETDDVRFKTCLTPHFLTFAGFVEMICGPLKAKRLDGFLLDSWRETGHAKGLLISAENFKLMIGD